jgi:uncharacterized protein YggE
MKRTQIVIAIAAVAVIVSACTPSVTVESPTAANGLPEGISVSGTGEVTGTPDTLTITFGVTVRRDSVSEAVAVAAEKAELVIASLTSNGVEEKDIQTANYSVYPEYDWTENIQKLIGYQVNNSVIAKIRNIENAGTVIDGATAAGGDETTVGGVSFSIEDNDELIEAARAAAWADAKAKAEQLASLSGVTLGAPTMITETFAPRSQPIYFGEETFAASDGASFDTPINPGEQLVAVSVSVQFSIDS